eukprot:62914-Prorocentrum_minimum.AAC.1
MFMYWGYWVNLAGGRGHPGEGQRGGGEHGGGGGCVHDGVPHGEDLRAGHPVPDQVQGGRQQGQAGEGGERRQREKGEARQGRQAQEAGPGVDVAKSGRKPPHPHPHPYPYPHPRLRKQLRWRQGPLQLAWDPWGPQPLISVGRPTDHRCQYSGRVSFRGGPLRWRHAGLSRKQRWWRRPGRWRLSLLRGQLTDDLSVAATCSASARRARAGRPRSDQSVVRGCC